MNDQFPAGQDRIIADLLRRVQKLEAAQRSGPGLNIGSASGPFFLPNSGTPANPSGGALIYASGGDFRVLTSGGVVKPIPAQGAAVANPAFPLTNATATYNQAQVQTIVNTADNLNTALLALLTSLRNAQQIAT